MDGPWIAGKEPEDRNYGQPGKKIKRQAGEAGKYKCFVQGCYFEKTNSHPGFSSSRYLYDHLINKHGNGYCFLPSVGMAIKSGYGLGVGLVAVQEKIVCKVSGCNVGAFDNLEKLGRHLRKNHLEILDEQPSNSTWKTPYKSSWSLNAEMKPKTLISALTTDLGIGKRYQAYFGLGYSCPVHAYEKITQNPEGLANHWFDEHVEYKALCPVKSCILSDGVSRQVFQTYQSFYFHVNKVHLLQIPASEIDFEPFNVRVKETLNKLGILAVNHQPK